MRDTLRDLSATIDRARLPSKVRNSPCASSNPVRIFERITDIFQDAHHQKTAHLIAPPAHLRQGLGRAAALHPVPFARKVVSGLASASIAGFRVALAGTPLVPPTRLAALDLGSLLSSSSFTCDTTKHRRFVYFELAKICVICEICG
jgi:hypothetical protein